MRSQQYRQKLVSSQGWWNSYVKNFHPHLQVLSWCALAKLEGVAPSLNWIHEQAPKNDIIRTKKIHIQFMNTRVISQGQLTRQQLQDLLHVPARAPLIGCFPVNLHFLSNDSYMVQEWNSTLKHALCSGVSPEEWRKVLGFAPAAKSAFAIGLGGKNERNLEFRNLELRAVMEKLGFAYGQKIRKKGMWLKELSGLDRRTLCSRSEMRVSQKSVSHGFE